MLNDDLQGGNVDDELDFLLSRGLTLDEIKKNLNDNVSISELVQAVDNARSKIVAAADVETVERKFLRFPDFPLGEVCVVAGAGGVGKGQFGCFNMVCLSAGIDYRTGLAVYEPCNSLFISTEDTAADIRARLDRAAVKGDLSRIFIVDKLASYEMGLSVSDDAGFAKIEALITETQAKFVILDPLQGLCGHDIDMSRINHIRGVMHGLAAVAERTQSVICLFCHPNKRQNIVSANDLISGSADIVSAARSVLLMMPDFENGDANCRLILHTKSNHAKPGQTMRFRIAESNSVVGLSEVTAADAVEAVNLRKLAKPTSKGVVDYEAQFVDGVQDLLSNSNNAQISFSEFTRRYAPTFTGKAKCLLDSLARELSTVYGIRIQTSTGKSEIRVGSERGFRCERIASSISELEEELPL